MCCAAVGDEFAKHGSKAQDDDQGAHDVAYPFLDGAGDLVDVETTGKAEADADYDEGNKGIEAPPDDEEDETGDEQEGEQERHEVKIQKKGHRPFGRRPIIGRFGAEGILNRDPEAQNKIPPETRGD